MTDKIVVWRAQTCLQSDPSTFVRHRSFPFYERLPDIVCQGVTDLGHGTRQTGFGVGS